MPRMHAKHLCADKAVVWRTCAAACYAVLLQHLLRTANNRSKNFVGICECGTATLEAQLCTV